MALKKIFFFLLLLLTSSIFAESKVINIPPKGTVALTFDDGPNPIYTPQILAILKKYNIKATFFMVGMSAQANSQIVKMVSADGHVIANHSLTHPNLTLLNDTDLRHEVVTTSDIIQKIIGKRPTCLRYPFNASNKRVDDIIRQSGMLPMNTGINSLDYKQPGVEKIVSHVLQNVHSGQIITMHDGFDRRQQTVDALPRIIEGIKQKGLSFSLICSS